MGTLAIMGILAIAGIWMYNSAMDKLKANTLINEAQKRAVVVAGQIGLYGRTDPTLGEFSDNTFAGGTFSTNVVTDGLYQQFGIQLSNVPKRVCQNILNSIGDGSAIRRLSIPGNPSTAMTTCADNNTFLMVYNNDMSNGGNETTYTTADCSCQTVCGVCVVEGGETKCVNECPTSQNQCTQNSDCSGDCVGCVIPSGQSTGTCQACQKVAYLESTGTQYIDTGYKGNLNSKMSITFQYTQIERGAVFGATSSIGADNNQSFFMRPNEGKTFLYANFDSKGRTSIFRPDFDLNKHNTVLSKDGWYFDNNLAATWANPSAFTTSVNIRFFDYSPYPTSTGYAIGYLRIFSATMYDANSVVHDFIPVHAPFQPAGKQNCMYDKVSKTLFCNAATGNDFTIP